MSATFFTDVKNTGLLGASIVPGTTISTNTTTDGTAVDCQLTEGPITGFFLTGDAGDASTTLTFSLVECDTSGGTYTAIADGALATRAGSATANDNLAVCVTATKRTKRYVKCRVVTAGGGTPSVPVAAFVLGRKKIVGTGDGSYVA
jgi:hypothetical protein